MQHVATRHNEPRHTDEATPLSESTLLILLSLAAEPRHGYSILKDVSVLSGGRVVLSTGTLYGALRRLMADEWIERIEEKDAVRGRIAYQLSRTGEDHLRGEIGRMKQLTRVATQRLRGMEA